MEAMPYKFLKEALHSTCYVTTKICPWLVLLLSSDVWGK